jgi:hypothetical protein
VTTEHEVERCLGGAPESREAAAVDDDLAQPGFPGLSPERGAFARQRNRHTDLRGSAVHDSAHRIQVVGHAIVGERLHDHRGAVVADRLASMPGHTDRIRHVVQAVEECDQVEILARVADRVSDLEARIRSTCRRRFLGCDTDRFVVIVVADELRIRICQRHQDGAGAVPAPDVGHLGSALQLVDDAVKRGQPRADQVGVVAGAEEAFGSLEEAGMMLTPLHARSGFEVAERLLERVERGLDDVVCAGHVDRAIRVGQAQRLLRTERPLVACGVVLDVSACALIAQPFADVALVGAGALRKLGRRHGAFRQFAVQPEPITDQDQRRTHRGTEIANRLAEEFVQLGFVDSHCCLISVVGVYRPHSAVRPESADDIRHLDLDSD